MSAAPIIRIQDLRFAYGQSDFALTVDELSIPVGQRVACVGPSGSGKTTLLHLMAGILTPERGRVQVGPDELSSLSEGQRRAVRIERIGLVFQEFELLESLTSEENIWLPYLVAPSLSMNADVQARARTLAASTGVSHVLGRRPARLSQGERQRIALCRALITWCWRTSPPVTSTPTRRRPHWTWSSSNAPRVGRRWSWSRTTTRCSSASTG